MRSIPTTPATPEDSSQPATPLVVSVITPSFNQSRFLPYTLDSVAAQTHAKIEHIVVDPGSTDGALEIARNELGVRLINEPDDGQADGINKGFAAATGDVLCWLNSDDLYANNRVIEEVVAVFDANPDVDVVYGRADFVDEQGEFLRHGFVTPEAKALPTSLQYQVGIVQPSVFFRSRVVESVGALDSSFEFTLDYEFWVRLALAGARWQYLDRVLSYHRWWGEMKTASRRGESYIEHFRTVKNHFGYVHHQWIERYTDYLLTGADGVVTHVKADAVDKQRVMGGLHREWNAQLLEASEPHVTNPEQLATLTHYRERCLADIRDHPARVRDHLRSRQVQNGSRTCVIVGNSSDYDASLLTSFDLILTHGADCSSEVMQLARYVVATEPLADVVGVTKVYPGSLSAVCGDDPAALFVSQMPEASDALFSVDVEAGVVMGSGAAGISLQLAYGLGYGQVLLLGFGHEDTVTAEPSMFEQTCAQARAAYERADRRLLNATSGGTIQALERVSLESVFVAVAQARQKALAASNQRLRVLVLSASEVNSQCATGALTNRYFAQMQDCDLLQLFVDPAAQQRNIRSIRLLPTDDRTDVLGIAMHFAPQVIYFRPSAESADYFSTCLHLIEALQVPVVTHVMDDWVYRHDLGDLGAMYRLRMSEVLRGSTGRLAISPGMATAYLERYGHSFFPLANFVGTDDLAGAASESANEVFTIRYCGGLDAAMTSETVAKVAAVVDALNEQRLPVRMEIYTMPWYLEFAESIASEHVTVQVLASEEDYPKLLSSSDLLLIGYNFDAQSIDYVRYSMANKLADYLNAGTPVLLVGPIGIETMRFCASHNIGRVCLHNNAAAIESAVRELMRMSTAQRTALTESSRNAYAEFCNSAVSPYMFRAHLTNAAFSPLGAEAKPRTVAGTLKYRYRRARLLLNRRLMRSRSG